MAQNMDPQWSNANFCTFYVFRMQTLILIILMRSSNEAIHKLKEVNNTLRKDTM